RDGHEKVQALASHSTEECCRRLKRDVARNGTQVAKVICEAFQLECDSPNALCARRLVTPGKRLECTAIGARVTDDSVSGDRLGNKDCPRPVSTLEQPLHATVLVAEHDLELEHTFAVCLESEVAGLDDPRVDGSN